MDFTETTFRYLDLAKKNQMKLAWFEKNSDLYKEEVRRPMADLVVKIWDRFQDQIPRIKIDPKRVSRPTRSIRMLDSGHPMVKAEISCYFAEKATSRFEWNPGIFFELSSDPEGNVLKVGLYDLISSRQTKIMRREISENFEEFHRIMSEKKFRSRFGGLQGETYKRFPRTLDENADYAQYLKYKMFYVERRYSREEVTKKNFHSQFLKDLDLAMPFLQWILRKVPVYQRDEFMMSKGPVFITQDSFNDEW
jgi:uncharacterized protein (TIGR02453 family)